MAKLTSTQIKLLNHITQCGINGYIVPLKELASARKLQKVGLVTLTKDDQKNWTVAHRV